MKKGSAQYDQGKAYQAGRGKSSSSAQPVGYHIPKASSQLSYLGKSGIYGKPSMGKAYK